MVLGFHSHKDCLWSFPDVSGYEGSLMNQVSQSPCGGGFAIVAIDLRYHGQSESDFEAKAWAVTCLISAARLGDPVREALQPKATAASARVPWCDSPFVDATGDWGLTAVFDE